MNETLAMCWLGSQNFVSLRCRHDLIQAFGTALKVYEGEDWAYEQTGLLKEEGRRELLRSKGNFEEVWESQFEKFDHRVLVLGEKDFPVHLAHISTPPLILYGLGNPDEDLFNKTLAIVGSRRASIQGMANTKRVAEELVQSGLTIVSGLALGIDTQAHMGALDGGGRTVAVLGSGLDVCYPKENQRLMENIVEQGGMVLSEFPPGTLPLRSHFPQRNRIISGLSLGVLVAEAEKKSGSLLTARHAGEQGREVYAFPGDLHRYNTYGSNKLIQDGAKLVLSSRDVLEDILPMFPKERFVQSVEPTKEPMIAKPQVGHPLSPGELEILGRIRRGMETVDDLYEGVERSFGEFLSQLTGLELKGKIIVQGGRCTLVHGSKLENETFFGL